MSPVTCTIRSHGDLKNRDANRPIDSLPESFQAQYQDAVARGCGCNKAIKLQRVKDDAETSEEMK